MAAWRLWEIRMADQRTATVNIGAFGMTQRERPNLRARLAQKELLVAPGVFDGISANGSRSAFSAGFTRDLAEVWAEKGKASMLYTAEKQPAVFFATCARLLPNDVRVTVEQQLPGNLSPADWNPTPHNLAE